MHDVHLLPPVGPAGVGARVGAGVVVGASYVSRQHSVRRHSEPPEYHPQVE